MTIFVVPSMQEISQCVQAGSEYFAALDLAHGYHQICLSDKTSNYTTFIVSCGQRARRYKFLCASQGLNVDGDFFNYHSDKVFSHLPGVTKLVNDLLIQAPTSKEFMERRNNN